MGRRASFILIAGIIAGLLLSAILYIKYRVYVLFLFLPLMGIGGGFASRLFRRDS